jgi:hypothetical protein
VPCAKWNDSASPATMLIRNVLTASFISSPLGTGPQSTACRTIGATSVRTRSASSPATMATSWAFSAGTREPDTGASTYRPPAALIACSSPAEYPGEVVPMCTTVWPRTRRSNSPVSRRSTSSTASPLASIISTVSAFSKTSATLPA